MDASAQAPSGVSAGALAGQGINQVSGSIKRAAVLERRRMTWEMRVGGASVPSIAKAIGISERAVWTHLKKAAEQYRRLTADQIENYIARELALIDGVMVKLWQKRHDPRTAETILHYSESRRRLLGLDRPTKVTVARESEVGAAVQAFDAERLSLEKLEQLESLVDEGIIDVTPQEAPVPGTSLAVVAGDRE